MSAGFLERLEPGMAIPFGGNRVAVVSDALAEAFQPGDRLIVIDRTGDLLRLPAATHATVQQAVGRGQTQKIAGAVDDDQAIAGLEGFGQGVGDHGDPVSGEGNGHAWQEAFEESGAHGRRLWHIRRGEGSRAGGG